MRLAHDDPLAAALVQAIHEGDVAALGGMLRAHPGLAAARLDGARGGARTPLLAAADWPGFFPNGARVVAALIAAGADVHDRGEGKDGRPGSETPLHWAASSDDADVAAALLDGGADIEAPGGSIGTPLANAVGYGCWQVARLLVDRGARVEALWVAAGLGLMSAVEAFCEAAPGPSPEDVNDAFWQACHGGQPRAAAYLRARGADLQWVPRYAREPPLAVARGKATRWGILTDWLQKQGATSG